MGKNIIYIPLVIILFIILDIFSRFLYAQSWLSTAVLTNEVNPIEILSLIISAAIAIWLGWYISKKLTAQRFEKEYIISDIKKIEEEITSIEKKMQDSNIELQTLLDLLSKFKVYIDRFSKTIDIFQVKSINTSKLCKYYSLLYRRTTDTESDIFNIDEIAQIDVNNICSGFLIETRKMIFIINKE